MSPAAHAATITMRTAVRILLARLVLPSRTTRATCPTARKSCFTLGLPSSSRSFETILVIGGVPRNQSNAQIWSHKNAYGNAEICRLGLTGNVRQE
jgi:hypothetical protein